MSLIMCPECNREVSDSAPICPSCGYEVKIYYEKRRKDELTQKKLQQRLINIPSPAKPKMFNVFGKWALFFAVCTGIGIWGEEIVMFLVGGAFAIIFTIMDIVSYNKEKEDYQLSLTDLNAYKRKVIAVEDEWAKYEASKIRCPVCNSTNVNKIDVVERTVSIGVAGLASGKIGKQYKCKNCKHMW